VKNKECQYKCDDDTELINRGDPGCFTDLQCMIIAQPGCSGRKARQDQEYPTLFTDIRKAALGSGYKYDSPRHQHYYNRPYGRGKIRIHALIPILANMDVISANTADKSANMNYMSFSFFFLCESSAFCSKGVECQADD